MNRLLTLFAASALVLSSCQKGVDSTNPFYAQKYAAPFEVPPFEEIKPGHFVPAFTEGMKQEQEGIDLIANNPAKPTFDNTIFAFDRSGELLDRVSTVFGCLRGTDDTDTLRVIAKEITPLLTQHSDNIMMNKNLFKRIAQIYEVRHESGLNASQIRVVEKYYSDFVRNGALLNDEDQNKLRKLNEELSMLSLQFGDNLLAETNNNFSLVVDNEADLAGLPGGVVSAAAEAAQKAGQEGKWLFTLQKPSWIPFLQYAENRELREKLYKGYFMRGDNNNENDNKQIITKIVELRAQKAKLLGFNNFAEYVIEVNMAQTPERVSDFLTQLWVPALNVSKKELAEMQRLANANGVRYKLESWDWWFWAEKLRKAKFNLDENELIPYFKLDNVRDGMFWTATKLYGLTFERITNVPVYNPLNEVYEVKEADGSHAGLMYFDWHPRAGKRAGAWCTSFRRALTTDGVRTTPLVSIVCNFTPPTGDKPALLNWDEVNTMFHEFGHGLHGLFTQGDYKRTAGRVARDFVELPSQIMEHWASEPEVMQQYARHYQTNEPMPADLMEKLQKSSTFNQGFSTVEYLSAAQLDMKWHTLSSDDKVTDAAEFEKQTLNDLGLIGEIIPRYRSTYFSHIFNGGYSAGYYVYIWAEVLDADAFDAFKESGDIFNQALAQKFRQHCLSECGEDEGMVQYTKFRGHEPTIDALLRNRGLN